MDYDIYHFGISGGKDSTALLLWAIHRARMRECRGAELKLAHQQAAAWHSPRAWGRRRA